MTNKYSHTMDPGTYEARAKYFDVKHVGANGTPMVEVQFSPVGADDILVRWAGWLTPKALDRTCEALYLLGWAGDFADFSMCKETSVDIVVEDEKDREGNTTGYSRVAFVNERGHAPRQPGVGDGRAIAADIAHACKQKIVELAAGKRSVPRRPAPNGGRYVPPPAEGTVPYAEEDDNIPF